MTLNNRRSGALLLLAAVTVLFVLPVTQSMAAQHKLDSVTSAALDTAIAGEHRSEENKARDGFRRPRKPWSFSGFDLT
jgi:predicted methyltransferase